MKKWLYSGLTAGLAWLTFGSTAAAQEAVPASERPPAGMCRIWMDGVPANRQPAPTDCATAMRKRPPNARIIFGEQRADESRQEPPQDRAPQDRTPQDRTSPPQDTPRLQPRAQTPRRSVRPPQRQEGEPPVELQRRRPLGQ